MAHFAELDAQNKVTRVIVVHNNELMVGNVEVEKKGIEFCQSLFGGTWLQTSYNGTKRKNYAGIGYSYAPDLDAFVPPRCHLEALLDNQTAQWICTNTEHGPNEATPL